MDRHVRMVGTNTVYGLDPMIHSLQFSVALVPMGYSVIDTTMFDWWSLQTDFINGMDHPGDPIKLLLMNGMRQHSGHEGCIQVPRDNAYPANHGLKSQVDHMKKIMIHI